MENSFQTNLNTSMLQLRTLVDITKTGIIRNTKPQGSNFTNDEWDFKRNQQRNFDTVSQLLGLRFQPMFVSCPSVEVGDFNEHSSVKIWTLLVDYEREINLEELLSEFYNVPIVSGLCEDVTTHSFNKDNIEILAKY